jgi:hypothetical protein
MPICVEGVAILGPGQCWVWANVFGNVTTNCNGVTQIQQDATGLIQNRCLKRTCAEKVNRIVMFVTEFPWDFPQL